MKVSIRFLKKEDAETSYKWRNNTNIWNYTGFRPDKLITYEIEKKWIIEALKRQNEIRFAICVGEKEQYVGNVQLTNITKMDAEFHIYIGDEIYHNKGIGTKATNLILNYAKEVLVLKKIYLLVDKKNIPAIKSYEKCGFIKLEKENNQIKMIKKLDYGKR